MGFQAVSHISLSVTDLDRSEHFYTQVLDFVVLMDFGDTRVLLHPPTSFQIALIRHAERTGEAFTERNTGLDHIGLFASAREELEEWVRRFDAAAVTYTPIGRCPSAHTSTSGTPTTSLSSSTCPTRSSPTVSRNCGPETSPARRSPLESVRSSRQQRRADQVRSVSTYSRLVAGRSEAVQKDAVGHSGRHSVPAELARRTARVLPVNRDGQVLLLLGLDPTRPDEPYWFTIGGGVEIGETLEQAAVRELAEEVGVSLDTSQLTPAFYRGTHTFTFDNERLRSDSTFFAARLDAVSVTLDGLPAGELGNVLEAAWWAPDDLTGAPVSNPHLPEIARMAVLAAGRPRWLGTG